MFLGHRFASTLYVRPSPFHTLSEVPVSLLFPLRVLTTAPFLSGVQASSVTDMMYDDGRASVPQTFGFHVFSCLCFGDMSISVLVPSNLDTPRFSFGSSR
jgi:hypothetical protein